LLGGVASASVLGVGVAAPTLARPVSHAPGLPASSLTWVVPVSSLTRVAPSGSAARRIGCDLPGLPQTGLVVAALAGALGAPCGSSDTPGGSWSHLTGAESSAVAAGNTSTSGRATSTLPRASAVTRVVSGLSAVTSAIPGLSAVTRMVPGPRSTGSVNVRPAGAVVGALSGLAGAFGGAQLSSQQP
jgi:hypothetical protein